MASERGGQPGGFFAAVRVVAFFTLISRFGGLFRDVAVFRVFGDSAVASAFSFAFLVPNVFRRLFGEGALSAAFLPQYASEDERDRGASARFASLVLAVVAVVTGVITVVGVVGLLGFAWVGEHPPERRLALELTALMLPFMPLICVAAALGGMLQAHGRFGPAAAAPVLLNLAIIAAAGLAYFLLPLTAAQTAYVVGGAVVVSGAAQVAWCAAALRPHYRWRADFRGAGPAARATFRRFVPAALGLGTLQVNTMLDALIASWPILVGPTVLGFAYPLDESSNAVLSATQRLYQFPLGVFGIAVATAVFPLLSRAASDGPRFTELLRRGVRLSLFIALPASAGLVLVRHDLTATLYGGGNFSDEGVARSAAALLGYAPAVWAYSVNQALTRGFYAKGDTVTPLKVAVACVGLNFVCNVTLIWVPGLREAGLAWSTLISAVAQWALLSRLGGRLTHDGRVYDRATARAGLATLGVTLLMACAVWAALWALPAGETWGASALRLGVGVAVGAASYGALAYATRRPELRWLVSRERGPRGGAGGNGARTGGADAGPSAAE